MAIYERTTETIIFEVELDGLYALIVTSGLLS